MKRMRIRLLSLLCLCTVGMARATPNKLPYTEKQFEMVVACIKHFEGWHTVKNYPYVGYGHQLQKGERYSARTLTKKQGCSVTTARMRCCSRYWPTMSGHTPFSALPNVLRADYCEKSSVATGTSTMTTSPSAVGMADK